MSTTHPTVDRAGRSPRSRGHAIRIALLALAIVAVFAVAFLAGRATATTTSPGPAITPAAITPTAHLGCHFGQPC